MALLDIQNLHKHFGGLSATDGVSLRVEEREIHAVIGPNGAGKTTLLAQLAGELLPDDGHIFLRGRDITHLPAHHRVHLGLARSFQITSVFADMSLLDNVALAVQARQGHSYRFWRPAYNDQRLQQPALQALAQVGLAARAHSLADEVSHGEHRQLEIAMALAAQPQLLLLDEPMAGMGAEESAAMIQILQALKGQTAMLLIEHDMDAVFALADRISVLVYGKIIASDTPQRIRNDPAVRSAYLGEAA
ncbi:MAG: ABC transporter ATP-binding protein [Candidatus Competibacteraceae bacterium]|nr:ABC transporter ATP-binding protein [Candidatus Competibacteraceae bacterium]MCB1814442.1 ABC transporter ATP-binding protein [Candidatus Competibacteraceae bacterium]